MKNVRVVMALVVGMAIGFYLHDRNAAVAENAAPAGKEIPLHLEGAIINAAGNGIELVETPVGAPGQELKYYDIECHLSMTADGTVHLDRATATPSVRVAQGVEHYDAGVYSAGNWSINVTGPGRALGGREVWQCSGNVTCTWITGPPEGNPELQAAGIPANALLPKGFSFGHDQTGHPVAVQATPSQLTISWLKPRSEKEDPQVYIVDRAQVWTMKDKP